jgi:predicted membrane-bound spermidine synthase
MTGSFNQMVKIIRIGFFEGMGLGAKYGAVIGFIIGVVVWSIFRSFSGAGFFFGGLLGLSSGAVIGFIIGGGMGAILNLSQMAAQYSGRSSRFRHTAYAGGLLFGLLSSYLFGRLPLHWWAGALLGPLAICFNSDSISISLFNLEGPISKSLKTSKINFPSSR